MYSMLVWDQVEVNIDNATLQSKKDSLRKYIEANKDTTFAKVTEGILYKLGRLENGSQSELAHGQINLKALKGYVLILDAIREGDVNKASQYIKYNGRGEGTAHDVLPLEFVALVPHATVSEVGSEFKDPRISITELLLDQINKPTINTQLPLGIAALSITRAEAFSKGNMEFLEFLAQKGAHCTNEQYEFLKNEWMGKLQGAHEIGEFLGQHIEFDTSVDH